MATSDCTTKTCTKCGNEYPATLEYFGPRRDRPSGLQSRCRNCERDRQREDKRKKRAADPEYARRQRARYIDTYRAASRRWYHENKERAREQARNFRSRNPDYANNWWHANSDRTSQYWRNYVDRDPERARLKYRKARVKRLRVVGQHTAADVRAAYSAQNGKCWWCGEPVGDTYHVDHRIPLARGGTNNADNICIACPSCNLSKGAKLPHEWIGRLL